MARQTGTQRTTTAKLPEGAKAVPGNVVAEGEVTGHAHQLKGSGAIVYDLAGTRYANAPGGAVVTHEEHGPVTLPRGRWRTRIVQEYDHLAEEARAVLD